RTVALRLEPGEARDELADVVGVLVERAEAGGLPGARAADGIGQPGHAVARGAHGGAQRLIRWAAPGVRGARGPRDAVGEQRDHLADRARPHADRGRGAAAG